MFNLFSLKKPVDTTDDTIRAVRAHLESMPFSTCLDFLREMDSGQLALLSAHKDKDGCTLIQSMLSIMKEDVASMLEIVKILETPDDAQYAQPSAAEAVRINSKSWRSRYSILKLLNSRAWRIKDEERPVYLDAIDYVITKSKNKMDSAQLNSLELLHDAAIYGDLELVEMYLKHGLDTSVKSISGFTIDDYAMYGTPSENDSNLRVREFYTDYLALKNRVSLTHQANAEPTPRIRL